MQTSSLFRSILAALCASFLASQTAFAASVLWSGATDDNWSTAGNWSGGTPAGNEVFFGDLDATGTSGPSGTANNIVNSSLTISRLSYTNLTTIGYHTTQIPLGVTLTLTNSGNTIFVNQPRNNSTNAEVYATVVGAGTLNVSNTNGVISIGQGAVLAGSKRATLDLSGLDTFNATLGRIILGQQTVHSNRPNATLLLAKTNFIDLAQAAPTAGLQLGDINSNNGNDQTVGLGVTNVILSNSGITVGGKKGNGVLQFNSGIVSAGMGSVRFRARDNVGRQAQWAVGDNSGQNGGGTVANGVIDFTTYGTVDALVDTMILGRGLVGLTATASFNDGTLKFDAGTVDVNNLFLGVQPNADGGNSRGTVNVDGTGQLIVNTNLQLGYFLAGFSNRVSQGILNIGLISGGSVTVKGNVVCAGGVGNKITLFGSLTVGGKLGDAVSITNTPLQILDLYDSTLTFDLGSGGNPASARANVTNLNVNGTAVTVAVLGTNLVTGQFPLMKYYSGLGNVGGTAGFAGLNLTLPGYVMGYLSNNTANASVDVVITNGPAPAKALTWNGNVDGNWNTNTLNWLDTTPVSASYAQGDFVTFDDSAIGATNVNLTTVLAPGSLLVSNISKTYTFNGSGALSGPTGIIKRGSGTLVLANTGMNSFANPVAIEGGIVQLSGSNDRVPTNGTVTLSDVAGASLDLNGLNQEIAALNGGGAVGGNVSLGAGNLTVNGGGGNYAGVISGGGAVIKTGTGTQVLSGANLHSGGIQVQGGTLTLANTSGSGAGSGSVSVTTTNATLRLGDGGANGSVSASAIANEGLVVLNRSDDLSFTTLITGGGSFRKENTNIVTIPVSNTYTGATTVVAGALRISNAGALGDTNGLTTIQNDATARLELTGNLLLMEPLRPLQKAGSAGNAPAVLNLSGTNTLAGPLELPGGGSSWNFQSAAGKLIISGVTTNTTPSGGVRTLWLSGPGDGEWNTDLPDGSANISYLRKDGTGTWKLGGTVTYTGSTVVSNGTLAVNGTIPNSSAVTVTGGTLGGTGSISAPITVGAAGNLAPGDGGIGTLSVLSNLTLNGTTTMELAKIGPTATNDQVSVLNTLTLGGTLNVSLTGTVTGGEIFQLFTAGTIAPSAFSATNLPGLPGGLTWDTSNLGAGTLSVSGAVSLPPAIPLNIVRAGDVLTFSWTNAAFRLQSQTNSRAVGLKTNWFDYPGGGTSPVLVTNNPANETVFFRLITP